METGQKVGAGAGYVMGELVITKPDGRVITVPFTGEVVNSEQEFDNGSDSPNSGS